MAFNNKKIHLCIFLSALLISLSTSLGFAFIKWFAFIPFLFILSKNSLSFKEKAFYSWELGFLFFLFKYVLLFSMHPLGWLGISNNFASIVIIFFIWIALSFVLSLPSFLIAFSNYSIYLFPFLWIINEYLYSWIFSIFTYSNSSFLGDNFSLGFIGYGAHSNELLLFFAPYIGGIYGVGFFIALINLLLFKLIRSEYKILKIKKYKYIIFIFLTLIILSTEFVKLPVVKQKDNVDSTYKILKIASVKGPGTPALLSYNDEVFDKMTEYYSSVVKEVINEHPDVEIIVLPEFTRLIDYIAERDYKNKKDVVKDILGDDNYRALIYGNYDYISKTSITTIATNDDEEAFQSVTKKYLMPLGEYAPFLIKFLAKTFGASDWISDVEYYRTTLVDTNKNNRLLKAREISITPVTCSEILVNKVYNEIHKLNPDIITQHQRLAMFNSKIVFNQTLVMSKFQAGRLRKYVIGSVDGVGNSYIIAPNGKVISATQPNEKYIFKELKIY